MIRWCTVPDTWCAMDGQKKWHKGGCPTNVTQKLTHKRYSILSNKHGTQKCSKILTLSWLFFDWKKLQPVKKNQLYET